METMLLVLVGFLFLAPLLTLIHELGHALVPLLEGRRVSVRVGEPAFWTWKIGQLEIGVGNTLFPWNGITELPEGERFQVLALALGPAASLAVSALCFAGTRTFDSIWQVGFLFDFCAVGAGVQFLATAIPLRYPRWLTFYSGRASDGLGVLNAWREQARDRPEGPRGRGSSA